MTVYSHRFTGVLPAGDVFSFGWHSDTGISLASSHAAAVGWGSSVWSGGSLGALFPAGAILEKVTTYQLQPFAPFHAVALLSTDIGAPGTNVGDSLPQDTAEVVSLRSANPTRAGRGRMYLPAMTTTSLTANGELAGASIATILTGLAAAWAASRAIGDNPVIFSRTTGLTQAILQFGVGTVFDRQSRRVNKVSTARSFEAMP